MMSYHELSEFLESRDEKTNCDGIVLLKALLESEGRMPLRELARRLLDFDEGLTGTAEKKARDAVTGILRRHVYPSGGGLIALRDSGALSEEEKRRLKDICEKKILEFHGNRKNGCIFCQMDSGRIFMENRLAYCIFDNFPVTDYHALIIPKRHVPGYFELTEAEAAACNELLNGLKSVIDRRDSKVSGYNIGVNCGESAGQSIFHCHIHLIPRRKGDMPNPRGGVRHVIPSRGCY
jgi:diadenosine tetraphosphate (Ap4A) HIT family hydrolase